MTSSSSTSTRRRFLFSPSRRLKRRTSWNSDKELTIHEALGTPVQARRKSSFWKLRPLPLRSLERPPPSPNAKDESVPTADGANSTENSSNDDISFKGNEDAIAREIAAWADLNEHDFHWATSRRRSSGTEIDGHVCFKDPVVASTSEG